MIFINIAKGKGELFATYMGLRIYLFTTFLSEVSKEYCQLLYVEKNATNVKCSVGKKKNSLLSFNLVIESVDIDQLERHFVHGS